eukprot:1185657-Prorocentrum_minimum.AAC.6
MFCERLRRQERRPGGKKGAAKRCRMMHTRGNRRVVSSVCAPRVLQSDEDASVRLKENRRRSGATAMSTASGGAISFYPLLREISGGGPRSGGGRGIRRLAGSSTASTSFLELL